MLDGDVLLELNGDVMVRTYRKRIKFRAVHNKTQEVIDIYKLSDFCAEHGLDYRNVLQKLATKPSVDTGTYTIERV